MQAERKGNFLSIAIKGVLTAIIVSIIGVLIFALVIKLLPTSIGVIKFGNQFLKALSVFLGCIISIKGKNGFVKGALIGLVGNALTVLIFSLISGASVSLYALMIDAVFGFIIGALAGAVAVNLKK